MPEPDTKDLNVKGIPRDVYERWREAAQRDGRSLSSWLTRELSAAAERVLTSQPQEQ